MVLFIRLPIDHLLAKASAISVGLGKFVIFLHVSLENFKRTTESPLLVDQVDQYTRQCKNKFSYEIRWIHH